MWNCGKWHGYNDPSSHPLAMQIVVSSFYCQTNISAVTKPSSTVANDDLCGADEVHYRGRN